MKWIYIILLLLFGVYSTMAQYGIDSSFEGNSTILHNNPQIKLVRNTNIQSQDKIFCYGRISTSVDSGQLFRLSKEGNIDNTFNYPGGVFIVINKVTSFKDTTFCIGNIETGVNKLRVLKLLPNGKPDSSFANNGFAISEGRYFYKYAGISRLQSGKLLISAETWNTEVAVRRYNLDGSADSSFGNQGSLGAYVLPSHPLLDPLYYPMVNDIGLTQQGKIIVGFDAKYKTVGGYPFSVARLLPNGSLDSTYGDGGIAWAAMGGLSYCKAMRMLPNDKVLLAGYSDSITVVRFDTAGKLDPTFGNNGKTKVASAKLTCVYLLPNGKILLAGTDDTAMVIYRLQENGALDVSFGQDGCFKYRIEEDGINEIEHIAVQSDGKILISGHSSNEYIGGAFHPFLLRLKRNANDYDNEVVGDWSLFPNPATDYLTIQNNTGNTEPVQIRLSDMSGKLLYTSAAMVITGSYKLPLTAYASGVYVIGLYQNGKVVFAQKVVKW